MVLKPHDGILQLKPYTVGKRKSTAKYKIELLRNENALGASPKALEAIKNIDPLTVKNYSDIGYSALREAIGEAHNLDAERIVCGNGSDELLSLLCHAFLQKGDEVIFNEGAFSMYKIYTQAFNAVAVTVPKNGYFVDVDATVNAVTDKTKIVMLANPDNPTGTYLPAAEIERLRKELPEDVLLVIDAAYAEYAAEIEDYSAGEDIVDKYPNTVMTRTFSKMYGMAGMRLGWCYAQEDICKILNSVRYPFNVSSATEVAGIAAVKDTDFAQKSFAYNKKWIAEMTVHFTSLGLNVIPTCTNFVYVEFPDKEGKTAGEALEFLKSKGILVRGLNGYGVQNALRINTGQEDEMKELLNTVSEFMEQ